MKIECGLLGHLLNFKKGCFTMKENCSMEEITKMLQAPFSANDIEWRVSRSGNSSGKAWAMVLGYVTNRAIQNRLDAVFGPAGWKNDFRDFMQGILCTISCHINGEWVSKADGAEQTQFESLKGGLSSAMKRAGSQWGIGRYLYSLEETFVEVHPNKQNGAIYINDKKTNVKGYWLPPHLPDWALPENERKGNNTSTSSKTQSQSQNQTQRTNQKNTNGKQQEPSTNNNNGQNKQQKGFDREKVLKTIDEYLVSTGLSEKPEWIIPLFKKINPDIKQGSLSEVFQKATKAELRLYFTVLAPVSDLTVIAKHYKVSMERILYYVQLLCPTIKIESLFSCLMHVTKDHVKEIVQMVKGDLKSEEIQQIA